MPVLLLSLIVSQSAVDLRLAPPVPPWPEDTPTALMTPSEMRCTPVAKDLKIGPGLWMPERLAEIINGRLEALVQYPEQTQARLDALSRIHTVVVAGAVDAAWADARALDVPDTGWPSWQVALATTGGVALGLAAGLVIGFVAGGR